MSSRTKSSPRFQHLRRRSGYLAAVLALAVTLFTVFTGPTTTSAAVPASPGFNRYTLQDVQGRIVTDESWHGNYVLVSFGYMNCSDVCPTTLWDFKVAMDVLGDDASRVRALFIDLDPNRDQPEVLEEYTSYFHPDIVPLTGTPRQVLAAADSFRVDYGFKVDGCELSMPPTDRDDYHLHYTSRIYLLGPDGTLLNAFGAGTPGVELADGIARAMQTQAGPY